MLLNFTSRRINTIGTLLNLILVAKCLPEHVVQPTQLLLHSGNVREVPKSSELLSASSPQTTKVERAVRVLDTGLPTVKFQTGGIVWMDQELGVRFVPENCGVLHSVSMFLETERLKQEHSQITLSVCDELNNTLSWKDHGRDCVTETFSLPSQPVVNAEWFPRMPKLLSSSSTYWLVVGGNSPSAELSFTWLDGDIVFYGDTTRSGYTTPSAGRTWVLDEPNSTLPTALIYAIPQQVPSKTSNA